MLAASAVGGPFVQYKRAAFVRPDETPVAFSLDLVAKDLDLILALASQVGLAMRQTEANREPSHGRRRRRPGRAGHERSRRDAAH